MKTDIWDSLKQPPSNALRPIKFGALKGKSDIDPMWRVEAMTRQFGPCGIGWKFEIDSVWTVPAPDNQHFAFAKVLLYIKPDKEWSDPIPGIGGNMLVQLANQKPKGNDEGYKMAVTDALGTAMKMIGVAADVYMGKFDGSKYKDAPPPKTTNKPSQKAKWTTVQNNKLKEAAAAIGLEGIDREQFKGWLAKRFNADTFNDIPSVGKGGFVVANFTDLYDEYKLGESA